MMYDKQDFQLLVFSASWCGKCRDIVPKIQEKVHCQYIDVDNNQVFTQGYNIKELPTFVLEWDNQEQGRLYTLEGPSSYQEVLGWLQTKGVNVDD